jgi:predicted RNase H-like nuclease
LSVNRFLGLDLGRTPRDESGGIVLEAVGDPSGPQGVRVCSADTLRTHEDTLRWITRNRGRAGAVLAINAPLIVENAGGSRPCDRALQEHFARYRVDEYSNNIASASHPRTMGKALFRMGFDPDPLAGGDRMVETHTQAAQVMLFGVDRPVRLKSGLIGSRKDAAARLRDLIRERLTRASPELVRSPELDQMMNAHLPDLNGTRLGELEGKLEALVCAYVAAFLEMRGPESCAMLGDLKYGYILLPDPSRAGAGA